MDLILLTKHFPYNNNDTPAEAYIETEIIYLAKEYSRVIVFATEAKPGVPLCSKLPRNVIPFALGCSYDSVFSKTKLLLNSYFIDDLRSYVDRFADKDNSDDSIVKKLFKRYFISKAAMKFVLANKIIGHIPDLHVNSIYSFWFFDTALLAVLIKNSLPSNVKVVSRAHRYDLYAEENRTKYLPLRTFLLENLDHVFPCSLQGEEYLIGKYPEFANKIDALYLGTSDLPDRSNCFDNDIFTIVSCSRIVPVKRVDLLLSSIFILLKKGYDIRWIHFGDGPDMKILKKHIQQYSCFSSKIYLRGFVNNQVLLNEYSSKFFNCFVNVSANEGLPISIMEACGIGLPVVATDVGGTSEIVKNNINGLLLSKNPTAEEVSSAIESIIALDDKDYVNMRSASRHIWEEEFRTCNNVKKLVSFYKTV